LLTTSRRPTGRIRTFCRDLANSIQDVTRVNRGKMSLYGIAEKALELEANQVIVVNRWRGESGKINLFQVSSTGLKAAPPLIFMKRIRLRREFEEGRRYARSSAITLESKDSADLERIAGLLSKYFCLPILSPDKARKNHRACMHFSIDSSGHIQITFMLLSGDIEIGPRITLSKLIWDVT
jgi:rRNA maturation protein Rpf1